MAVVETLKRFRSVRTGARAARGWYWRLSGSSLGESHVRRAIKMHGAAPSNVLVVGCNTGYECASFLRSGAETVTGIDVLDEIGSEHRDRRIQYVKTPAESLPFDAEFDLVYCFATLEHVHGLESAFSEMARVLRPGGTLYTLAAPLWYSPYGHHHEHLFAGEPWIHLRMNRDEILESLVARGLSASELESARTAVNYMLDPAYFNRRHARDYRAACDALDLEQLVHRFAMEPRRMLDGFVIDEPPDELLATTHRFVGRRPTR